MTETQEVKTEDEGGDLIPKEQLPTDPTELAKEPSKDPADTRTVDEPAKPKDDTPADPADSPASSSGDPVEKPEEPKQPAPVEGETPREKALRLEVARLRGLNRKSQVEDLANGIQKQGPSSGDEYQVLRDKGYSEEEIANMETAIDLIASKKGYVRADKTYAQTVQDTVDIFLDEHSEYKPSADVDDVRWNLFQSYLKDGTYNLSGKTPKQLKTIFEKVDADVKRDLGEVVVKTNPAQVAAARHKIGVVSHSGGTKSQPEAKPKINPTEVGGIKLKGFDPEDFE